MHSKVLRLGLDLGLWLGIRVRIRVRDDLKTQLPVDQQFCLVSIVLNNDNRLEPAVEFVSHPWGLRLGLVLGIRVRIRVCV